MKDEHEEASREAREALTQPRDTDAQVLSEAMIEIVRQRAEAERCASRWHEPQHLAAETTLALIADRERMRAELRELETLLVTPGSYEQGACAWGFWALASDVLTRIRRALGEDST